MPPGAWKTKMWWKTGKWCERCGAICLALVLNPVTVGAAFAAPAVLDRIEVETGSDVTTIRVFLNVPLQYRSHTPAGAGDHVRIQMRPISTANLEKLVGRQSLGWKATGEVPLSAAEYEGAAAASTSITLRFTRPVVFSVEAGIDPRVVMVTVQPQPPPATSPDVEASDSSDDIAADEVYAVNLMSSPRPIVVSALPGLEALGKYRLYTSTIEKDGRTWHRLRVGFFETKVEAELIASRMRKSFPQAWITEPSRQEAREYVDLPLEAAPSRAAPPTETGPLAEPPRPAEVEAPGEPSRASDAELSRLMDEARDAMTAERYERAIQLYTKILRYPEHAYSREAQELLGLARDRNGQRAHAKAEYEQYLRRYPEGDGTGRVRQRLDGLLTADKPAKTKLRRARRAEDRAQWDVYGGMSQFYRRAESFTDPTGRSVDDSALFSDLAVTGRRRGEESDVRGQFTGSYEENLQDHGDSELEVNELYMDGSAQRWGLSSRVGRQSLSSGGVLGRFDGGLFSYQAFSWLKANAVLGYPVDKSTSEDINTDKHFYGMNFDIGTFRDRVDFNVYVINQEVDGITDRRAVGAEARYFDASRSVFGVIDYDFWFNELNAALLVGNWTLASGSTLNMTLDYRNSPALTTSNAAQGTGIGDVSELRKILTNGEIRKLAEDRTPTTRTLTFGASHPLNEKLQISGDFTVTDSSGISAVDLPDPLVDLEGFPSTGPEFFYATQLIGSNLIKSGDITTFGLRFADGESSDTLSFDFNTRYPINSVWRINPRVRFDWNNADDNDHRTTLRPSSRVEFTWKRNLRLEIEAGGEWMRDDVSGDTDDSYGYFLNAGYRWDF